MQLRLTCEQKRDELVKFSTPLSGAANSADAPLHLLTTPIRDSNCTVSSLP